MKVKSYVLVQFRRYGGPYVIEGTPIPEILKAIRERDGVTTCELLDGRGPYDLIVIFEIGRHLQEHELIRRKLELEIARLFCEQMRITETRTLVCYVAVPVTARS